MKYRAEFFVGKQLDSVWSGVFGYAPEESFVGSEMYAVVRLASDTTLIDLERLAKVILKELQEGYYNSASKDGIVKLEDSVWKMRSMMETILSREQEIAKSGIDLEMALAVVEQNFLYAGVVGESQIYIKRGDRFVDISKALVDSSMSGFLKSGSMKLEESDKLLLSTSKALTHSELLDKAISGLTYEPLESLKDKDGIAVMMIADANLTWKIDQYDQPTSTEIIPEVNTDSEMVKNDSEIQSQPVVEEASSKGEIEYITDENIDSEEEVEMPTRETLESKQEVIEESQDLTPKVSLKDNIFSKINSIKSKVSEMTSKKPEPEKLGSVATQIAEAESEDEDLAQTSSSNSRVNSEAIKANVANLANKSKAGLLKAKEVSGKLWQKVAKDNNKTYAKILRDIGNFFKRIFEEIVKFIKREVIGVGDRKDIYLKANRRKRNRWILIILIVVSVLLIINFVNTRKAEIDRQARIDTVKQKVSTLQTQYDSISLQVNSAKSDLSLKQSVATSLDNLSKEVDAQKKENLFTDDLNKLAINIAKSKDDLLLVSSFTEPQIVTDLGKIYPDSNVSDMVYTNGNLYLSDFGRNMVYQLGTTLNSQPTQFATGLNQPFLLTLNASGDILFYDNDPSSALGKISVTENGKITRFTALSQSIIGKITEAAVFAGNDAIYELHQNHRQIYKRERSEDAYTPGGALFNNANPPSWKEDSEFSEAIDIAVPYEIYVLINGGGLRRYLAGEENTITYQTFNNLIQTDFDSMNKATAIDVTDKYLVVADPTDKRVLLFGIDNNDQKTLTFLKQYVYKGSDNIFKSIKEVIIQESSNTIFVLDGLKVIRLGIE